MDPVTTIFVVAIVAGVIASVWQGRRRVLATLDKSFSEQRFETPQGIVTGDALRVVKRSRQSMPFAYADVFQPGRDPTSSDSMWYCVGPGPSYFVAIPMVTASFGVVSVQWAVRPLTESRMRVVLRGDRRAMHAAFGE